MLLAVRSRASRARCFGGARGAVGGRIQVDLKSWHGYVIAPGSPHAATGKPYRLEIGGVAVDTRRMAGPVTAEVRAEVGRVRDALRASPMLRASLIAPYLGAVEAVEAEGVTVDWEDPEDPEDAARWALVDARRARGGRDPRMACPWCGRGDERTLRVRPDGAVYCHHEARFRRRRHRATAAELEVVGALVEGVLGEVEGVTVEAEGVTVEAADLPDLEGSTSENGESSDSPYLPYIGIRTKRPILSDNRFAARLRALAEDHDPSVARDRLDAAIAELLECSRDHYEVETYVGCGRAAFLLARRGGSSITRHLATCGSLRCDTCGPALLAAGLAAWRGLAEWREAMEPEVEAVLVETGASASVTKALRGWSSRGDGRMYVGLRAGADRVLWILSAPRLDTAGKGIPQLIRSGLRGRLGELARIAAEQVTREDLADVSGDIHLFRGPLRGMLADIREILIRRRDAGASPRRGVRLFSARPLADLRDELSSRLDEITMALTAAGEVASAEALAAAPIGAIDGGEVEVAEVAEVVEVVDGVGIGPTTRVEWISDEHLRLPPGVDAAALLRAAKGVGLTPAPGKADCPWAGVASTHGSYYSWGLAS